jgi:hypothetical protein
VFKSMVLAAVVAAAAASPAAGQFGGARLMRVTNGSCITMQPDERTGFNLTNACSECRTALVSWCDGDAHEIDVRAHGTAHIGACRGVQTLLSDAPCQHR